MLLYGRACVFWKYGSVMVTVGFVLEPTSTQSIGFFLIAFDPAYVLCNFQLMVYSAAISKSAYTYISVCFFSFLRRKETVRSIVQL